jgi:hypothetical protein
MGMKEKFKELLSFMQKLFSYIPKEKRALFDEFLKEIGIEKKFIEETKIKDKDFKKILKSLYYDKKLENSLKKSEPPQNIRDYIKKSLKELKAKIKEFFKPYKPNKNNLIIKEKFEDTLSIIVSRRFFREDNRILPTKENTYNFELSYYYRKEEKRLELELKTRFKVKESEINSLSESSSNLTIFDDFANYLGFSNEEKSVQFNAIVSEGDIDCSNDCDVYWLKFINM